MKLLTSLFLGSALIASVITLSSCSSDEDPEANLVDATTPSSFSYVVDETGVGQIFTGPTYSVTFDDDHKTAVVNMENVRWNDDMQASSYSYSDVDWKFNPDNKARVIDVARVVSDAVGNPEITDLAITMYNPEEIDDGTTLSGLSVSYTAAGTYNVTNIPYRTIFAGATETVNESDNSSYVTTSMYYTIDIDPDRLTAVMKIENVAFAESMPTVDMEFSGLNVTLEEGGYRLTAEQLIPTIAGVEYPAYNVTRLSMSVDLDGESELVFYCTDIYKITAYFEAVYSGRK